MVPVMATKSRHLKTALQLWISDERKARGETPGDLARLTGVTDDTARGWESRGAPSADALAVLERHFGKPAPRLESAPSGDLATAIRDLTIEMGEWRRERAAFAELQTRVADMEQLLATLAGRTLPAEEREDRRAPRARPETTGSGR